jgi:hypothetical protein
VRSSGRGLVFNRLYFTPRPDGTDSSKICHFLCVWFSNSRYAREAIRTFLFAVLSNYLPTAMQ